MHYCHLWKTKMVHDCTEEKVESWLQSDLNNKDSTKTPHELCKIFAKHVQHAAGV